jgi:septal ring factor EnvC (AmiA/AmiB activator)
VYQVAKAKGDTAMMERSLGYAGNMSAVANNAAGQIDDDLKDAIKNAKAQEKEEAQKAKEARERENSAESSEKTNNSTSDTLDIATLEINDTQEINAVASDVSTSGKYGSNSIPEPTQSSGTTIDIVA